MVAGAWLDNFLFIQVLYVFVMVEFMLAQVVGSVLTVQGVSMVEFMLAQVVGSVQTLQGVVLVEGMLVQRVVQVLLMVQVGFSMKGILVQMVRKVLLIVQWGFINVKLEEVRASVSQGRFLLYKSDRGSSRAVRCGGMVVLWARLHGLQLWFGEDRLEALLGLSVRDFVVMEFMLVQVVGIVLIVQLDLFLKFNLQMFDYG